MSVRWVNYIWEQAELQGSELLCALALADHTDAHGRCHPEVASIASKIRLEVRQTQRLLRVLADKGYLTIEHRPGRGRTSHFQMLKKGVANDTFSEVNDAIHDTLLTEKPVTDDTFSAEIPVVGDTFSTLKGVADDTFSDAENAKRVSPVTSPPTPPYKENHLKQTHTAARACAPISESGTEADAGFWTVIAERRLDSPFENPKWSTTIAFAAENGLTPEDFGELIDSLRSQDWRKARITPETVANNLGDWMRSRGRIGAAKPAWQAAIDACGMCDSNGLRAIDGTTAVCRHRTAEEALAA